MPKFEWDENKNASNKLKHNVSFEDAKEVFNDEDRIQYASDKKGETRYLTIGKAFQAIITVISTTRDVVIRIISARRANKEERRAYLTNKFSKQEKDE